MAVLLWRQSAACSDPCKLARIKMAISSSQTLSLDALTQVFYKQLSNHLASFFTTASADRDVCLRSQILSFDQTDQMRALLQLSHLPLQRLVFKDMGDHSLSGSMEYHYQSGLQRPKNESMFRPVYASPYRRLTMKEILERLPPHMRLAAANGAVPDHRTDL